MKDEIRELMDRARDGQRLQPTEDGNGFANNVGCSILFVLILACSGAYQLANHFFGGTITETIPEAWFGPVIIGLLALPLLGFGYRLGKTVDQENEHDLKVRRHTLEAAFTQFMSPDHLLINEEATLAFAFDDETLQLGIATYNRRWVDEPMRVFNTDGRAIAGCDIIENGRVIRSLEDNDTRRRQQRSALMSLHVPADPRFYVSTSHKLNSLRLSIDIGDPKLATEHAIGETKPSETLGELSSVHYTFYDDDKGLKVDSEEWEEAMSQAFFWYGKVLLMVKNAIGRYGENEEVQSNGTDEVAATKTSEPLTSKSTATDKNSSAQIDDIERLAQLRSDGVLNDDEFEQMKRAVLEDPDRMAE